MSEKTLPPASGDFYAIHATLSVDNSTPGFKAGKLKNKIALRVVQNGLITLEDCRVPEANRLRTDRRIHMGFEQYDVHAIGQFVGQELGVSDWLTIDQERINEFADCTGDHQWIHVDVERAERESPLRSTIAHGYLTLSLLSAMQMGLNLVPEGVSQALNYGLDRVRFIAPVKAGARIRNRVVLLAVEPQDKGRFLLKFQNTVEIEDERKPALIAETLALFLTRD